MLFGSIVGRLLSWESAGKLPREGRDRPSLKNRYQDADLGAEPGVGFSLLQEFIFTE